ncbi:hypothetical protein [Nonomuraea sp. NPDC050643]|uniref:hypothetical protein n=1 Tax=Nonomuraea sp. NPDC050643 TaxID=3155660 RepID=UPI0033E70207
MTTNRLTPDQRAARHTMATDNVHLSFGQGRHGGWGYGMAVPNSAHLIHDFWTTLCQALDD